MIPAQILNFFFLLHARFIRPSFLNNWQRSKDILLDHVHHPFKIGNDELINLALILKEITQFRYILKPLIFFSYILLIIIKIKYLTTKFDFFNEDLLVFDLEKVRII